jgi:ketosteroid isomerase-like protein
MRRLLLLALMTTAPALLPAQTPPAAAAAISRAIDTQVWNVVAATVVNSDIVGMGKLYHPSAVYVDSRGTQPIADVLAGWGKDMVTMKNAGSTATVELRFGKRQDNATTAFQSGAFKYTVIDKAGARNSSTIAFEALLTRHNGAWRILMEHQIGPIDAAAWDRLPH